MLLCSVDIPSTPGRTPDIERIPIMTSRRFGLAALATVPMIGSAVADERINLTPPLYRDQARATASVRPATELVTTPRLVPAAPAAARVVATATMPDAETSR
jgi:hypothetical protein